MGRKVRTNVPQTNKYLISKWSYLAEFKERNMSFKRKQKENFDNRHRTRDAPEIPSDAEVRVNTGQNPIRGRVVDLPRVLCR